MTLFCQHIQNKLNDSSKETSFTFTCPDITFSSQDNINIHLYTYDSKISESTHDET